MWVPLWREAARGQFPSRVGAILAEPALGAVSQPRMVAARAAWEASNKRQAFRGTRVLDSSRRARKATGRVVASPATEEA